MCGTTREKMGVDGTCGNAGRVGEDYRDMLPSVVVYAVSGDADGRKMLGCVYYRPSLKVARRLAAMLCSVADRLEQPLRWIDWL